MQFPITYTIQKREMAIDRNLSLQRQANLLTGTLKARDDAKTCPNIEKNAGQEIKDHLLVLNGEKSGVQ